MRNLGSRSQVFSTWTRCLCASCRHRDSEGEANNQIILFLSSHPIHVSRLASLHFYLPKGASLLREEVKSTLKCGDRREGSVAQPRPALEKVLQALKGIQAQPIVSIIRQMSLIKMLI